MAALRYALSFALISVPLTWLWINGGDVEYLNFLRKLGRHVFEFLGIERVRIIQRSRYMNLIPFVALVLVTPRLGLPRRAIGLVAGLVTLVASHLAFSYVTFRARRLGYSPILVNLSDAWKQHCPPVSRHS